MPWIAVIAWLAAVVVALVILGFCAYELVWKARRLRADLQALLGDTATLDAAARRHRRGPARLARTGVH